MSTYQNVLWEGQTLVIEYGHYTGRTAETGNWASHREIWALEPDGRLRIAIVTRAVDLPTRSFDLVYRRQ